jgi:hypothetical protein
MNEEKRWISIERLLDDYSIPVLAEAIDKFDVQTIDVLGRRILASNGDENDIHSKVFAKVYLAQRRAFELDPLTEDEEYWYDERIQTHGSALDLFGWPKDQLPDFTKIQPDYQPDIDPEWWSKRSSEEFKKEFIAVSRNFTKAAEIHGVSRQRYTEVIKAKCDASLFER